VSQIRDGWGPGVLDADIQLTAQGTVRGDGTYQIALQSAVLKAWWPGMTLERGAILQVSNTMSEQNGLGSVRSLIGSKRKVSPRLNTLDNSLMRLKLTLTSA
jgi:hypothetical protein